MTLKDASWQHRNTDIDSETTEPYAHYNVLRDRTPVVSRNLQVYTWVTLAACFFACGFFIAGWKQVLCAVAFALVVGPLFAWIGYKRRR